MAVTVAYDKNFSVLDTTMSTQRVRGTITFSGNYPTNGDTLNLSGYPVQSNQLPIYIDFSEMSSAPSAPGLAYTPGTTQANGKLVVFTAYNTQVTAGAYPAPILGTTFKFEAIFPLGM